MKLLPCQAITVVYCWLSRAPAALLVQLHSGAMRINQCLAGTQNSSASGRHLIPDRALPVFLDRDGVINANRADYVKNPSEWIPVPGAISAIAALHRAGHPLVVVTNQSGIGRGYYTAAAVEQIHGVMLCALAAAGVPSITIMYCPHHPKDKCGCRKPETGMTDQARLDLKLPSGGWMVGDAHTDMELGRRSGLETILVLSGRGSDQLEIIKAENLAMPDHVTDSLVSAVEIILTP